MHVARICLGKPFLVNFLYSPGGHTGCLCYSTTLLDLLVHFILVGEEEKME